MPEAPLPEYTHREEVPRDLRTAAELSERGFRNLGPARARLRSGGASLALYSTSEARRRRDGMWHRASERAARAQPGADVVAALAAGRAGWVRELLDDDFVVLDTETTGLGRHDEIIEVGVVDATGATLLETLVWPHAGGVPPGATRVHGLTLDDLAGAPTWPHVLPRLEDALRGRRVVAWNAPFDQRMARQSSRLWGVREDLPAFECAMRAYALARGVASGRSKLASAAAEAGVLARAQRHRSADDARLTLAVLTRLGA